MVSKILIPHDGTEMSDKAVAKAVEFAKAFDAEIVLLHVIEDIPILQTLVLGNDRILIAKTKRSIAIRLEEGWKKMAQQRIINNIISDNKIKVQQR